MKGPLNDQIRVKHILDAISEVETYIAGVSLQEFLANSEKRFATTKQIEIIGEACNYLSAELKKNHDSIEWRPIIAFRNISIHEYFGVNFKIVWEIATIDLPILKGKVSEIAASLQNQNP
jgi:uncharacterized protein with HEPN domain